MKLCPFCAEEIQDAAIRCKHCRSDLGAAPPTGGRALGPGLEATNRSPRVGRRLVIGAIALLALLAAAPVLGRTISRAVRDGACQPSSWGEWHAALRKHCLDPSYVCRNMTTTKLLEDPELVSAFGRSGSNVADVVGRMRDMYGCSPEREPAFHPSLPEPGPFAPPAFPPTQDVPRAI